MNKLKYGKRKGLTVAVIALVLVMCLSVLFTTLLSGDVLKAAAESKRITMLDLMARYPIDYVVGPVDVVDVNNDGKIDRNDLSVSGKFTYKSTNYELDFLGNKVMDTCEVGCTHQKDNEGYKLTNNTYGIPADKYFDVESYIYTEPDTVNNGRTLRGWKKDIQGVYQSTGAATITRSTRIAENGEMLENGNLAVSQAATGIYVTYNWSGVNSEDLWGTTEKYALIVPSDITKVGQGSAAFATTDKTYYQYSTTDANGRITTNGSRLSEYESGSTYYAEFTDFSSFITVSTTPGSTYFRDITRSEPYVWQPRERLAGVFFPEDSRLTEIEDATEDGGSYATTGRSYKESIGKGAFQNCNNMRFMILPSGVKTIGNYAFCE
ncbi:MAG: leucine-rich repeat domain-containing protein, partial [Clostridia bacterium]|nr:leucine-rich repeat domain-containing protein [Clostridia bacterium]